jgi:hypothetical protein
MAVFIIMWIAKLCDHEVIEDFTLKGGGSTFLQDIYNHVYSASHSRVAPENVGLQKEQKCNTFACHACNEVRLCVLGIRKKEVGNMKR